MMIEICGRKIKVQTGEKSQTINICSSVNRTGQYDYIIRLVPPSVSADTLLSRHFNSILDLVEYLELHHSGEIERRASVWSSEAALIGNQKATPDVTCNHPLVELFQSAEVNSFASVASVASAMSEDDILLKFEREGKMAPFRGLQRPYFVGHHGKTTSGVSTNRREEHLAIALWRAYRESAFALPDGTRLFPVDYQVPLKSYRDEANAGLGKVDLLCVESNGDSWICELKIQSSKAGLVDTPLKACLEALAYCAILDPDMRHLSRESEDKKRMLLHVVDPARPNLLILAPDDYWDVCDLQENRYCWKEPLEALRNRIECALKIKVQFIRMKDCSWKMASSGMPAVIGFPIFNSALQNTGAIQRLHEATYPQNLTTLDQTSRLLPSEAENRQAAFSSGRSLRQHLEDWQVQWAEEKGLSVGAPPGKSATRTSGYVRNLQDNLFEQLSERVKRQLIAGAGGELDAPDGQSGNLYAVYSSSALCINFFHYWSRLVDATGQNSKVSLDRLLNACGLPAAQVRAIDFEVENVVNPVFKAAPHVDVQISFDSGRVKCAGIESKFCEPYGTQKLAGLFPVYLRESALWKDWPSVHAFAQTISPEDITHSHLHAAQLIKHLLGLKKQNGSQFVLVYLWFDVPGTDAAIRHRGEIDSFSEIVKRDAVPFVSRTYQELFHAFENRKDEDRNPHIEYLRDRYLKDPLQNFNLV